MEKPVEPGSRFTSHEAGTKATIDAAVSTSRSVFLRATLSSCGRRPTTNHVGGIRSQLLCWTKTRYIEPNSHNGFSYKLRSISLLCGFRGRGLPRYTYVYHASTKIFKDSANIGIIGIGYQRLLLRYYASGYRDKDM